MTTSGNDEHQPARVADEMFMRHSVRSREVDGLKRIGAARANRRPARVAPMSGTMRQQRAHLPPAAAADSITSASAVAHACTVACETLKNSGKRTLVRASSTASSSLRGDDANSCFERLADGLRIAQRFKLHVDKFPHRQQPRPVVSQAPRRSRERSPPYPETAPGARSLRASAKPAATSRPHRP